MSTRKPPCPAMKVPTKRQCPMGRQQLSQSYQIRTYRCASSNGNHFKGDWPRLHAYFTYYKICQSSRQFLSVPHIPLHFGTHLLCHLTLFTSYLSITPEQQNFILLDYGNHGIHFPYSFIQFNNFFHLSLHHPGFDENV